MKKDINIKLRGCGPAKKKPAKKKARKPKD